MDKLKTGQANSSLPLPQPTLSVAGFRSDNGMCFNSFHCLQSSNGSLWSPKISKYRKSEIWDRVCFFNTSEERAHQFSSATEHFGRGDAHTNEKTYVWPTYCGANANPRRLAGSRSISDRDLSPAKWESRFFPRIVGLTYGPKFHMVENRLSFSYRNQPPL